MTSGNPDAFYSVTCREEGLKMLTVASICTLKREHKKCGHEEVF